jgi:hypothetical protein
MKLPPAIESRLVVEFPPEQQDRARIALRQYGKETFQRERDRVLNAILDLAEGRITELECLLERALRDYRDVLFWHDNPEESKLETQEKRDHFKIMCKRLRIRGVEID